MPTCHYVAKAGSEQRQYRIILTWALILVRHGISNIGGLCTVRLTSTGNPVPGNKEFCLAPNETMVEQEEKIRSLTQGIV